jgi:hypothetical protein
MEEMPGAINLSGLRDVSYESRSLSLMSTLRVDSRTDTPRLKIAFHVKFERTFFAAVIG